jgi:GAF domain-containing protein
MAEIPEPYSEMTLFTRLGDFLLSGRALSEVVDFSLSAGKEVLGSMDEGSISLVREGQIFTSNATSSRAEKADEAQYGSENGPCLAAISTGHVVVADLEETRHRWPEFADEATAQGFRKTLSLPLLAAGETVGTLNLYSENLEGFDEFERDVATQLAQQTSIVLATGLAIDRANHLSENLRQALVSRETIGIAMGILMAQEGCSRLRAFDILRRASQRQNHKLRDVAAELVQRVESRGTEQAAGRPLTGATSRPDQAEPR